MGRLTPLVLCLFLAGCGAAPLRLLTGGGPNVAANVQGGKTNTQTIGQTNLVEQSLVRPQARRISQSSDNSKLKSETVQTVVMNEGPDHWWVIGLIIWSILLWQLPSPSEMGNWFRRKKHG